MNKASYHDRIAHKPWGYEYTIFKNLNKLALTFVKINYNQKTSLHCHPKKKTGSFERAGIENVSPFLDKEEHKANLQYLD